MRILPFTSKNKDSNLLVENNSNNVINYNNYYTGLLLQDIGACFVIALAGLAFSIPVILEFSAVFILVLLVSVPLAVVGLIGIIKGIKPLIYVNSVKQGNFQTARVAVTRKSVSPVLTKEDKEKLHKYLFKDSFYEQEEDFFDYTYLANGDAMGSGTAGYISFNGVMYRVPAEVYDRLEVGQNVILIIVKDTIMGIAVDKEGDYN